MTMKIMQRLAGKVSVLIMVALLTAAMGTYGLLKWKHGSTTHAAATASKEATQLKQAALAAKLPLVFEPNLGQTNSQVKFVARSSGYVTFLTGPSQAVLKIQNDAAGQADVVTMNLAGANAKAQGGGIDKTSGVSNYYIGNDRSKWLEGVPNYAKVRYHDVYPGIDVVYQGDDSRFRYDFVVRPGADPGAIRLQFDGARNVHTAADGSLAMNVGKSGHYASSKPVVYQEFGGRMHAVEGTYALNGSEARFRLGAYDKSKELVIDPNFTTATYFGAPGGKLGNTHINAISGATNPTINGSGSVILTGYTLSLNYPTAGTVYQAAYGGTGNDGDAIVASFPYNMQAPKYSTYFGGSDVDVGTAIAADNSSTAGTYPEAVVTGYTQSSTSFPVLNGVGETGTLTPAQHIFLAKFASSGTLLTSSVLYGNGSEKGLGVAVDAAGGIHLTGSTTSTNLFASPYLIPTTLGAQKSLKSTSTTNAFYLKLTSAVPPSASVATYLGGTGTDTGNAIAVDTPNTANLPGGTDASGGAFALIVGTTSSTNFPSQGIGTLLTGAGVTHAFMTEINTATGTWGTCPGATCTSWYAGSTTSSEAGTAAAIDSVGDLIAGGNSAGVTAFAAPAAVTLLGGASAGGQDGFVIELPQAAGGTLVGTLVNGDEVVGNGGVGSAVADVTALTTDGLNQIYITGAASNTTGPAAGQGALIRRRAFAGLYQPAGAGTTPFLSDYPNQETNSGGKPEVLPLGDLPLGVAGIITPGSMAPTESVANGQANGVSYDPSGNNACFGGFVSQPILDAATATVNSVIPQTSYQNDTTANSTAVITPGGVDVGILGCATYNSDTIIQINGTTTNNPTFSFSLPVGTTNSTPATQSFQLVNFNPSFPNPTYNIIANTGGANLSAGTIPFLNSNYSPNTTASGGLWLQWAAGAGDTISLSVVTANAEKFDPGVYTASFYVVPIQGDNGGVPQKVTVTLTVTGQLSENTSFGGGVPMSQTVPNGECVVGTETCSFTVSNGATFTDGNAVETIQVPYLSLVPVNSPTPGAIAFNGTVGPDPTLGSFTNVSWNTAGPAGGAACGGPPGIAPPDHHSSNAPEACYVTLVIPASDFADALNGVYTNTFTVNVTGLNNPDQNAPENSASSAPALPMAITLTVTVNNNALLFTGNNQFSSPVGPKGQTTITTTDILDSKYLNTTTATSYTATGMAAVGAACPGGTATAGIPGFAFGNNGTLPASNAVTPDPPYTPTQIPYPVSVPNPGSDAPGTYATTVTITASTGQTASMTYCLTVGNTISVSFATNDLPNDAPPLYIEAGTAQPATMTVTALGTLIPQAAPPAAVAVPFTISANAANPNWEVLQASCIGATLTTPTTCNIDGNTSVSPAGATEINPPLQTNAGEYDPAWTVTATGTLGDASQGADQALVTPPLPTMTAATAESFVFRTQVTSGVDLFYWTDFSLFADSANQPPGNYVTGTTLASETNPAPPYLIDPIYSIAYPGGGTNPDWPGTTKPIVLQFYEVQNSGVFEMQDGTPAGEGPLHLPCTVADLACQNVYITASAAEPRLTLAGGALDYTFTSVPFLVGAAPGQACHGFAGFGPPAACTLESDINNTVAGILPPGQYTAFYTISTTDGLSANIPQPSPTTVEIILTVIPNPSVTLLPNPLTFSYNVGAPATSPASINLSMGTSAPSGPVAVTLTPTAGTATVALSVNGGAPSTNAITVCVVGGQIQDCKGNKETVTASIANLAGLTVTGSYGATIQALVPPTNLITGLPNAPVSNSSFSVPVNVVVSSTPAISISPNLTFNWTVGQAATSPASSSMTITLAGNDTYTVTSSADWVTLGAPVPNNTAAVSTVAVSINLAAADLPAAGTSGTSTITVKGASGESATATVTLAVAATPVITLTPPSGVSNPDNITYFSGSPDPGTIPVGISLTNTPENPTYAMTAMVNAAAASWCAASNPGNVNNAGGSFTVTLTPNEANLAVSATPYTCTITVGGNGGLTSTTFTINLTVSGPTLTSVTPNPVIINIPVMPTITASSMETMAGTGTYSFKTTPATLTPQPPNSVMWLAATNPAQLTNGAGTMTVSIPMAAADTLAAGQYVGSVAFQGPSPTPFNLPVTLNVAQITASPSSLTPFIHYINYTTPTAQTVMLTAPITGGGDAGLAFTVTASQPWITVTQTSGTTGVTPATLSIVYNPTGLAASSTPYTGNVMIAMTGSSAPALSIPVSLTVNAEPTLSASMGATTIAGPTTGNAGNTTLIGYVGGTSVMETLTINGSGLPTGGTMPFTASVSSTGGWLQLQSGAGLATSVTGTTGGMITLVANPAGLSQGTYDGALTISGANASNSLNILVVLSIPGTQPCAFSFSGGAAVNLSSAGTATTTTVPGGALPENPVSATITPAAGATCTGGFTATSNASWLTVTVNGSSVTYTALSNSMTTPQTGTITVSSANGGSESLTVTEAGDTETQLDREVRALYQSMLGRDPDAGGFVFWTGVGSAGLGQMADSFITSPESFNTNFAVMAAYQGATGAAPTYAEFLAAVTSVRGGASPMTWFTNLATTNNLTVAGLYQNLLNRQPTAAETTSCTNAGLGQCWANLIGYPGTNTPDSATNNEFQSTGTFQNLKSATGDHTNALYVRMLYYIILDRDPDTGGLQFWLGVANTGGAGILFQGNTTYPTRIQIEGTGVPSQGFVGSPEFISRFQ